MSPVEVAYQEELKNSGLAIPLAVHPAFKASLDRTLDLLERAPDPVVARAVKLGRFETDEGDVLLVPNDEDLLRRLRLEAGRIAGNDREDLTLRVRAQDLLGIINRATTTAPKVDSEARRLPTAPPRPPARDPKVTEEEVETADVGAPKMHRRLILTHHKTGEVYPPGHKREGREIVKIFPRFVSSGDEPWRPGDDSWPLTVAYGLGVDSTAILVGLAQLWRETKDPKWRPEAITFADTGGEKRSTYEYLAHMDDYLERHGFPRVTVVATAQGFSNPKWGSYRTLEQKCLVNHTLPTIAFGFRKAECSITWKQVPQQDFFSERYDMDVFRRKGGPRIIRAVGYDETETERACGKGGQSTYRAHDEASKFGDVYEFWYPLIEWGWSRARCIAEIRAELGSEPPKSSCTFCPAMKPWEILSLDADSLERAIFMEQVAKLGRRPLTQQGLNPAWSWTALALVDEENLPGRGDVIETARRMGPRISRDRVDELIRLAKKWVRSSPRKPYTRDVSEHPVTGEVAAFSDILGFRDTPRMDMDKANDESGDESE